MHLYGVSAPEVEDPCFRRFLPEVADRLSVHGELFCVYFRVFYPVCLVINYINLSYSKTRSICPVTVSRAPSKGYRLINPYSHSLQSALSDIFPSSDKKKRSVMTVMIGRSSSFINPRIPVKTFLDRAMRERAEIVRRNAGFFQQEVETVRRRGVLGSDRVGCRDGGGDG